MKNKTLCLKTEYLRRSSQLPLEFLMELTESDVTASQFNSFLCPILCPLFSTAIKLMAALQYKLPAYKYSPKKLCPKEPDLRQTHYKYVE